MKQQQTYSTKQADIKHHWHLIDLKGQILGRVAVKIARLLQGKDKVYFTSHLDCGDYVVAINAAEVKVTGRKAEQKLYRRHSGYPSGLKTLTFNQQLAKDPTKIILSAVKNMLPKNKLRKNRLARLKLFSGVEHNYEDKFSVKGRSASG